MVRAKQKGRPARHMCVCAVSRVRNIFAVQLFVSSRSLDAHNRRHLAGTHTRTHTDSALEKHCLDIPTIKGNEISFTFPLDDRVCTIDEMVLLAPPPPPPLPSKTTPTHARD